jgi:eukaryotic-like serine/threonine-protein kinase
MATVYKAHQAGLARFVAIKVLPEFLATEEGFKERFQQEAQAVAKLRHPNILAVFDYGDFEGTAYIVNEFVDGGTLGDQLGSPLPMDYVANSLMPIASALDYAHSRSILHRDIKPTNILMTMDGTPVLADFGLAKMMERSGPGLTQSGMIVGTPEYMSPEQCSGEKIGPAADIYSLGVVAYQMLTGQLPFTAATPAAVINAQLHNELPPPSSINADLSGEIESALLKGLAKNPADRHKNATTLIKALQTAAHPTTRDRMPTYTPPVPPEVIQPTQVEVPAPPVAPPPSYPPAPPPSYPPAPPPSYPPIPSPAYPQAPPPSYPQAQSPYQPAWQAQPPSYPAYGRPTGGAPYTPTWVTIVLGLGVGIGLLWVGGLALYAFDPTQDSGTRLTAFIWGIMSLAAVLLATVGLVGVLRRTYWGRPMAWAAAVALTLTCVGALAGVPVLIGLGMSRGQSRP